jgi:hypothetical protein
VKLCASSVRDRPWETCARTTREPRQEQLCPRGGGAAASRPRRRHPSVPRACARSPPRSTPRTVPHDTPHRLPPRTSSQPAASRRGGHGPPRARQRNQIPIIPRRGKRKPRRGERNPGAPRVSLSLTSASARNPFFTPAVACSRCSLPRQLRRCSARLVPYHHPRHPSPPPLPSVHSSSSPSTPLSQARAHTRAPLLLGSGQAGGGLDSRSRRLRSDAVGGRSAAEGAANGVIGRSATGSEAMRRAPQLPLLLAAALLALAAAPGLARAATDAADGTLVLLPPLLFVRGELVLYFSGALRPPPLACWCSADFSIARWFRACMRWRVAPVLSVVVGGAPTAPKQGVSDCFRELGSPVRVLWPRCADGERQFLLLSFFFPFPFRQLVVTP